MNASSVLSRPSRPLREPGSYAATLDLLDYLACPLCGGDLVRTGGRGDVAGDSLTCRSGCGTYPVHDGVPRLLPELVRSGTGARQSQARTRLSFGAQWRLFRYGGTTWGLTVEQRIPVVLHELQWNRRDLAGKVILDAGCGNGTLSRALADRGATVVAVDLSDSVLRAQRSCGGERLHFVQGNLFHPPLKQHVFDAIYSCGVFHHTPDTRRCFDALIPCLKNDLAARYFVWLYARRGRLFNATVEPLMKVTRRMPGRVLVAACLALSPIVESASRALRTLRVIDHAPRALRDRAVQLHDLLSPRYVWYHSFDEARAWAHEAGLERVCRIDYRPADVPPETRAALDRYRTVCRPGFGMMCRRPDEETTAA